jgi:hypothetical protein
VGSAAAISRGPSKKTADYSPELKRQADEITEKILSRMRESVLAAALHALDQQKNDSSARIWMERRIFRPAQQIFERAIQVKKAAIPPPSTRSPERGVEVTGTWKKVPDAAKSRLSSIPAPSHTIKEKDGGISPLERVLARPDRAAVPASKRPTPPPPGVRAPPSASLETSGPPSSERANTRPKSESTPSSSCAILPCETPEVVIPPVVGRPSETIPALDKKLSALPYLDTPKEQAAFILDLIVEAAPAKSVLLHIIDPRTQTGTVVGAHGAKSSVLFDFVTEAQDPLLTQIRRLRRPVKILSPATDDRSGKGRWAFSPPEKYLIALPVLHGQKLLGFIELADPMNENRLTPAQIEVLVDLAAAWGSRLVDA